MIEPVCDVLDTVNVLDLGICGNNRPVKGGGVVWKRNRANTQKNINQIVKFVKVYINSAGRAITQRLRQACR